MPQMSVLRVKDGVLFTVIAPGGFRILSALDQSCEKLGFDLWLSSGCDGAHSGPLDPHHEGKAYDVRSHDFTTDVKTSVLATVMGILGWDSFYGFLEDAGTANEHFHFQVKKGTIYPPNV